MNCELRIIRAKNLNIKSSGVVFVRCYLFALNNKRVRIESQEIPSKFDHDMITWNQTFSLDCLGSQESIKWLKHETLVFELRRRSSTVLGRIQGSKLIGRAEIPWKDVMDSTNMEIEKWVVIMQNARVQNDITNSSALQMAVRIQEIDEREMKRKKVKKEKWDERCGCMDGGCNSCLGYEFFAIEAALEAL